MGKCGQERRQAAGRIRLLRGGPGQDGLPDPSECLCLVELGLSADRGLSSEEAAARLQRYGPNELEQHAPPSV